MHEGNEQLLAGLKNRELEAYEKLFKMYHGRLVMFARKFTGDLQVAQDIVQDAFLTLWEKSDQLTINESPKSYLFQAVRNRSLNFNRHINVRRTAKNEILTQVEAEERKIYSDSNNPYQSLLEHEIEDKINDIVNSLPDKCREVYLMSRQEHFKNKEIADKLGVSVKMVEKQISKALRILRVGLTDFLGILLLSFLQNL